MNDWTCTCAAINPVEKRRCWKCHADRPETPLALGADTEASTSRSLRDLFLPYIGETIGINFNSPTSLEPAILVRVNTEMFAVSALGAKDKHYFPFRYVLSVVEAGGLFQVEVHRQVFVRGGASIGLSVPIG